MTNDLTNDASEGVPDVSSPLAPRVTILFPVYNGERFLSDQLDSLIAQTESDWHVLFGDDGSTDTSFAILTAFAANHPDRATVLRGPQKGITANVLFLLDNVDSRTRFMAFCDQDDIWYPDKLATACDALADVTGPALFCSRTNLIDSRGRFMRKSPSRPRAATFQNALVQNIASGNTMVLNVEGWHLLQEQSLNAIDVTYHDWWAYQIITGAGGSVIHDKNPSMSYRQHAGNALGAATGLRGTLYKIKRLLSRDFAADTTRQITALQRSHAVLTAQNAALLDAFVAARDKGPLLRLHSLWMNGLYRQSRIGTLGVWLSTLLGRY